MDTSFEAKREVTLARNRAMLLQLGLGGGEHLPLQQAASAPAARKPRQRQARPDGPLRRSSRPASAQAAHKLSQQSAGAAGEDAGSESDGGASWEDPGGEEEEGEEEDGDDEEVVEAEVDELVQTELPPAYAGGGGGAAEHGGAAAASGGQRKRQRAGEPKKGGLKGSNLSAMETLKAMDVGAVFRMFDARGVGAFTAQDVQRVARANGCDFSDEQVADMLAVAAGGAGMDDEEADDEGMVIDLAGFQSTVARALGVS